MSRNSQSKISQTKFKKLVKIMVEEDISRWQRWIKGEYFPWDAVTSG